MDNMLMLDRQQVVRFFNETRMLRTVVNDDGYSEWTFAGGAVLVLEHDATPPRFYLGVEDLEAKAERERAKLVDSIRGDRG